MGKIRWSNNTENVINSYWLCPGCALNFEDGVNPTDRYRHERLLIAASSNHATCSWIIANAKIHLIKVMNISGVIVFHAKTTCATGNFLECLYLYLSIRVWNGKMHSFKRTIPNSQLTVFIYLHDFIPFHKSSRQVNEISACACAGNERSH
jgi:hypothetical protein